MTLSEWLSGARFPHQAAVAAGELSETSEADLRYAIATSFTAYLLGARAAADRMGDRGDIVFIGSMSAYVLGPGSTIYAGIKYGIQGFSQALRRELGPKGIRVSNVDRLGALTPVTCYGNVNQPGTTPAADVLTGNRAVTYLELRYSGPKGAQLGFGVSNLSDAYPRPTPTANNSTGVLGFPYSSPFGFNGRYLYVRAGLNW